MKWKAQSFSEAGEILKLLARQGEPLLKKLDDGDAEALLGGVAQNDESVDEGVDNEGPAEAEGRSAVAG